MKTFVQNMPRGFTTRQIGAQLTYGSSTALPVSGTFEFISIKGRTVNSGPIYMGFAAAGATTTGYLIDTNTILDLPMEVQTLTIFLQSAHASACIDYIALGSGL